jgi:3',5'-cyclic AMP phosphodiesterase CpdA
MKTARISWLILLSGLTAALCFGVASAASFAHALGTATVTIGPYVQAVGPYELTVCWETESAVPTRLHWGATPDCPVTFEDAAPATRHEAALTGLRAATSYWYRLDDAGAPAQALPVTTQPDRPRALRIGAFGDTRTNDTAHAQVVADVIADGPDVVVHTGDLVASASESYWQNFFRIEAALLRSVPLYPVLGNHEGDGARFVQLFVLPQQGGQRRYYETRWGAVSVIGLDTNQAVTEGSAQWRWLANTLAASAGDPSVTFRLVLLHHGPFDSGSGHGSNLDVRSAMVPLFQSYGVDVVISGHNHDYERGTVNGIKYVVSGGGGAPLYTVNGGWWTEVANSAYHHCLLEIGGTTLHFSAREAGSDRVFDEFVLEARGAASPTPTAIPTLAVAATPTPTAAPTATATATETPTAAVVQVRRRVQRTTP